MLIDRIDAIIATELKSGNKQRYESVKLIKAALLNLQKSGKPYTEESELKELMKLKAQMTDSIEQYTKANRDELAEKERFELFVLSEFLPKEPTDDEIIEATNNVINELGRKPTMADMKMVMAKVKETYPTANGKIISNILNERTK